MRPAPEEIELWRAELNEQVRRARWATSGAIGILILAGFAVCVSVWTLDARVDRYAHSLDSLKAEFTQMDARIFGVEAQVEIIEPDILDQMGNILAELERRTLSHQRVLNDITNGDKEE